MAPSTHSLTAPERIRQQEAAGGDRLPVLLLLHGPVSMRALAALQQHERLELFVIDRLTPEWISLAPRVSGTIVATEGDPMRALVYAVSGGIREPFILLCAKRYRDECAEFRAAGAADCVMMPVSEKDAGRIAARLASKASLSRVDGTLRLLLDATTLTARFHGASVRLTQREMALLQCLISYRERPVAAHKIVSYVWGSRVSDDNPRNILDVYICQLRRKLDRLGLKGAITTVRGIGYALVSVAAASQPAPS